MTTATINTPVTESIHTETERLRWLASVSQQTASAHDGERVAHETAAALAEMIGISHYAIALQPAERDELEVDLRNAEKGYAKQAVECFDVSIANQQSPIAVAAISRQLLSVKDLLASSFADPFLLDHGLRSAAVMPLSAESNLFGVILLGDAAPRDWAVDELALLEAVGHMTSAVIARATAQQELKRHQALVQALRNSMDTVMIVMSPDGKITDVNQAACDVTGFDAQAMVGRSIWSALMVAEDVQQVKQAFARLHHQSETERFESFVLKNNGQRRRLSWSVSRLDGDQVGKPAIVCTGNDITERCEAVERAARAEATAAKAHELFTDLQDRISAGEEQISAAKRGDRLPKGVDFDRRARVRREYPCTHLVAPLRGDRQPNKDAFMQVKCSDISSRGFAFLTATKPDFDKIVVAIGTLPSVAYLTADVRHVTQNADAKTTQYVVGCRYTGRVPLQSDGQR